MEISLKGIHSTEMLLRHRSGRALRSWRHFCCRVRLHGATQSVDTIADTLINNDANIFTPLEMGGGINHAWVNSALIPYGVKAD